MHFDFWVPSAGEQLANCYVLPGVPERHTCLVSCSFSSQLGWVSPACWPSLLCMVDGDLVVRAGWLEGLGRGNMLNISALCCNQLSWRFTQILQHKTPIQNAGDGDNFHSISSLFASMKNNCKDDLVYQQMQFQHLLSSYLFPLCCTVQLLVEPFLWVLCKCLWTWPTHTIFPSIYQSP